jgi:hypothetical protein
MSIYSTNLCPEVIDPACPEGHIKMITIDGMWKWALLEDVLKMEADKVRLYKAERESIIKQFCEPVEEEQPSIPLEEMESNVWKQLDDQVIPSDSYISLDAIQRGTLAVDYVSTSTHLIADVPASAKSVPHSTGLRGDVHSVGAPLNFRPNIPKIALKRKSPRKSLSSR